VNGGLNGYDCSFLDWFRGHGWCIHEYLGQFDVWSFDDSRCPFKVTSGMVDRLVAAQKIKETDGPGFWDKWWMI
jgi:hypothetical protein